LIGKKKSFTFLKENVYEIIEVHNCYASPFGFKLFCRNYHFGGALKPIRTLIRLTKNLTDKRLDGFNIFILSMNFVRDLQSPRPTIPTFS